MSSNCGIVVCMGRELFVEQMGVKDVDRCECCGNSSRMVWGMISTRERTLATYYVHWTREHIDQYGANFDFIVGRWGDDAPSSDRVCVSLEYRVLENGPAFRVIDSDKRPVARSDLVGRALRRNEVIGEKIAKDVFEFCDQILIRDERVAEILCGWAYGRG